jgi:hypothetical protein
LQPERPVQTTLAFHASRIVIDAGVLLAMAAMSMPFVIADSGDRSALDADALPVLLLLLPIFVVTLIPDHTRPIHPVAGWASLAFGLAALPYALVKMLDATILADTLDGSVGLGAWLMVISCFVTVVGIGIGIYRQLRGLPAGGTPGRSTAFRSKPKASAKPFATAEPESALSAEASDAVPTRLMPAAPDPDPAPEPSSSPAAQPEIVFPDTGAVAREADPDPTSPPGLHDTAERADAALDDHLMSMFDSADTDETDETNETDETDRPDG